MGIRSDIPGKLFLLPNTLGGTIETMVPQSVYEEVKNIRHFIVEELRSARRWLRAVGYKGNFDDIQFSLLNEHTVISNAVQWLTPALHGESIGLISEAGSPCIADPGSWVVWAAHQKNIRVVPLCGGSSILLALISSGLNGQHFAFNGYLSKEKAARLRQIQQWEQLAYSRKQTQLFMDTPYWNEQVFQDLITVLRPDTLLCIAADITCATEDIKTMSIREWKKKTPALHKRPVMFVLGTQ